MTDYLSPVRLSESRLAELTTYIRTEVNAVLSGREGMMSEWRQSIEDYEAEPATGRKDFPFEGACNIIIPTISTTADAIFARELNTVFSLDPLWTIRPMNQTWFAHAKPSESFLEWAQKYVMSMYDVCWSWYMDATILGTAFVKMPWIEDVRRQLTYLANGAIGFDNVIHHLGPRPEYLPIQDVLMPDGDWDVQSAPWIGNFFRLTKSQLASRKRKPYGYEGVDDLKPMSTKDSIRVRRDQIEGFVRSEPYELYELLELWVDWDVNGDGFDEQLVVTYSHDSEKILRVIYNPYLEAYRPYFKTCFMKRPGRAYGIGVARMLRQIAGGITTQFQQFVDNATLANTRIWKARRGCGIKRGDKLYAGKVMFLNSPDDLVGEQMGDVYNSEMSMLGSLREAGERRTGLSDVHLGIESPRTVNRMPATNMLSLLQEGNRRFDLTIRDMRLATAKVGEGALALYQQFRPTGVLYNVLGSEGHFVEEIWRLPRSRFKGNLQISVTATSQANNREIEKQSLTQLIQSVGSYYERAFQLLGIIVNPQSPGEVRELAIKTAAGAREMMKRLLQAYAVHDIETLLPDLARIRKEQPSVQPGAGVGGAPAQAGLPVPAVGGGNLGVPGAGGAGPGVAGLLSATRVPGNASLPRNGPASPVAGAGGGVPVMGGVR